MSPTVQALLSGAVSFGVPLLFAANELYQLRRPGRGGHRPDPAPEPQPAPPRGDAPAQRPLPPCLIPNLPTRPTVRERELEPA